MGSFNPVAAAGMTARATLASEDGVCTAQVWRQESGCFKVGPVWEGRQSEIVQDALQREAVEGF